MASKALFVLALLFSAAILFASAAEQNHDKEEKGNKAGGAGVQDIYRGGGYPGHGGDPGRGRHCRWGCCRGGRYGGCACCTRPDEIPEPMYRPEAHP